MGQKLVGATLVKGWQKMSQPHPRSTAPASTIDSTWLSGRGMSCSKNMRTCAENTGVFLGCRVLSPLNHREIFRYPTLYNIGYLYFKRHLLNLGVTWPVGICDICDICALLQDRWNIYGISMVYTPLTLFFTKIVSSCGSSSQSSHKMSLNMCYFRGKLITKPASRVVMYWSRPRQTPWPGRDGMWIARWRLWEFSRFAMETNHRKSSTYGFVWK